MRDRRTKSGWMFLLCGGCLLLAACSSTDAGFERSRSEYDYVPPSLRPAPMRTSARAPAAVPMNEEPEKEEMALEMEDKDADDTPSFFGRLFGRNRSKDEPVIDRVGGDTFPPNMENGDLDDAPGQPTDNVYRLRAGDDVFVTLSGSGGLNEQIDTKIDSDGNIKLRFIGAVKAQGLSSTDLEKEIKAEYTERQKIYREITVRVLVPNTFYFIGGEVRQPGRFPMIGRVTLSQAIVAAGNFTEWANNRRIVLVRNNERAVINFREIMQDPAQDVELLAGDVITVERSTF